LKVEPSKCFYGFKTINSIEENINRYITRTTKSGQAVSILKRYLDLLVCTMRFLQAKDKLGADGEEDLEDGRMWRSASCFPPK
jgi:hypothetical protein